MMYKYGLRSCVTSNMAVREGSVPLLLVAVRYSARRSWGGQGLETTHEDPQIKWLPCLTNERGPKAVRKRDCSRTTTKDFMWICSWATSPLSCCDIARRTGQHSVSKMPLPLGDTRFFLVKVEWVFWRSLRLYVGLCQREAFGRFMYPGDVVDAPSAPCVISASRMREGI